MKLILFLAIWLVSSQTVWSLESIQELWVKFKLTHKKQYSSETEELFRSKIFTENARKIDEHNKLFDQGSVSFKLGLNKYADLLNHEFVQILNGFNRTGVKTDKSVEETKIPFSPPGGLEIPIDIDWRNLGAVTAVKDQGQCGSCWSFSSTGALEGQNFRKTGQLVSLSEQNLVDCTGIFGNNGCNGGLMTNAFLYVKVNDGIAKEDSYPYIETEGVCHYNPLDKGATDKGFIVIEPASEKLLQAAVTAVGPVSVAIDASHLSFQFYLAGIYHDIFCSDKNLDHAVLVVGYGTDKLGLDYWLIKNSWGETWGEKGYFKLARNRNNHCGVASQASYPLV